MPGGNVTKRVPFFNKESIMTLTVGSLFSGIGGIDLGLERAGMKTLWQIEKDEWCRKVLTKHWPFVRKYEDVTDINWKELEKVDVLCGGFPCQPFSSAGSRKGIEDERWLWPFFKESIAEIKPKYVIIENSSDLVHSPAIIVILSDLSNLGYNAEWTRIRASAFNAPHPRPRSWIVAYSNNQIKSKISEYDETPCLPKICGEVRKWPDPPRNLGVDDGLSKRLDKSRRLKGLGNAVVPQIAEWLGNQIIKHSEK